MTTTKKLAALRPSARTLHGMLPASFVIRYHVEGEAIVGATVLHADGKDTGLSPTYPGFMAGLEALVAAGLVLAWGSARAGHKRVDSLFTVVRVVPTAPAASV